MAAYGLIFDFDGTICLSEAVHMDSWVMIARAANLSLPENFIENGVGVADAHIAMELEAFWGGRLSADEALAKKCADFRGRDGSQLPLVSGVLAFLEFMLSMKIPMALATSSSINDISPVFEAHGLNRFFKQVFTIESVTRPKPDPEIYLKAKSSLGVDNFFVFEDSLPGVTSARAAGGRVIGIGTAHSQQELAPLHGYIRDFSDVDLLKGLLGI